MPDCPVTTRKKAWVIDEPAAEVVKRIFQMSVSGLGPTQIAKRLKSDGVLTPTEYWHTTGKKCGPGTALPCNWCSHTVAEILDRQEYVGDTVNFRSFSQSFKLKKRLDKPQEEWKVFPNTHPAIIDRETFELVSQLRQHRRRPTKSGIVSIFSGLLYCADCGSKLGYSATNNYKREIVHEFIEKIVVSQPDKVNGKRHQQVDIYYNTIGLWAVPEPEVMEQNYLRHYEKMTKKQQKTA